MKVYGTYFEAHKADRNYRAAMLVELGAPPGGAAVYRWTNWSQDLLVDTNGDTVNETFIHTVPFTLSDFIVDLEAAQALEITFANTGQALTSIALNEGSRDRTVKVWEAWIDMVDASLVKDFFLRFSGRADSLDCDEESAEPTAVLVVGPNGELTAVEGLREEWAIDCQNLFKDPETCGYSGGLTTCNRTYTDCKAHANHRRFGGIRWALTPGTVVQFGTGPSVMLLPKVA